MKKDLLREIPNPGTTEDMFDRLYCYIDKVDKEWINQIKPASKEKIDRLIMLSDIEKLDVNFPKEYIKFLETMGVDDGGVLSSWIKSETKIDSILEFYEWIDEDRRNGIEDEDYEERKFTFAYDYISEEFQMKIFADGSHKILESFPEIYETDYRYDSFEKMLFYSAFEKYEKMYFNCKNSFVYEMDEENRKLKNKKALEEIEKKYLEKKYEKVWFSEENHLILCSKDISIKVEVRMFLTIEVLGDEELKVEGVIKELQTLLKAI